MTPEARPPRRLRVDPSIMHDLQVLRPWVRGRQIATQWMVCALAIVVSEQLRRWPVTVLALMVIATRQHALLVLMHDAAHHLLSKRRWLNDLIGNLFLAFPMTVSVARYRQHHLLHHRHLNGPDDPDRADSIPPATRGAFLMLLLRDVSGLTTLATMRSANTFGLLGLFAPSTWGSPQDRALALVFIVALATTLWTLDLGLVFALYWLTPILLFLPVLLRVRGFAEHGGRLDHPIESHARSIRPGLAERWVWAPCDISLHWEHHTCPSVPCYNLPALSARLAKAYPQSQAAHPVKGYFLGRQSLLNELYPCPSPRANAPVRARHGIDRK